MMPAKPGSRSRAAAPPRAAVARLRVELAHRNYIPNPIALGINTDAYQPIERRYRITRQVLELLAECQHPVSFVTKGAMIEQFVSPRVPTPQGELF